MRMQRCPHCGAENSAKRATCYSCEKELSDRVVARSGEGNGGKSRGPATSRWQAIEPIRQSKQAAPPLADSVTRSLPAAAPEETAPRPPRASPVSRARNSMTHVRRMAMFYRELHTLVKSGINLASASRELETRAPAGFRGLARDMAAAVEAGRPISSALAQHPSLLYPWHLGVIRAAEAAGTLPEALDQIAAAYELEWETRSKIALQIFYYCFVLIPGMLIALPVIMMMQQPIPKEGWSNELTIKLLTHYLMTISLPAAGGLLGLLFAWRVLSATAWFQRLQERVVLLLPVFGGVSRIAAAERYLSTLGMLLKAGVPLTDAVNESALAAGNLALTPRLLQVAPKVQGGMPLAQALQEARIFDADTLRLAGTGEMTGSLPEMLGKAAEYVRDQHAMRRKMLLRLSALMFAVVFGVIVAMIFYWGLKSYFNFVFRFGDWMSE